MAFANLIAAHNHGAQEPGGLIQVPVDTTAADAAGTRIYEGSGIILDASTHKAKLMSIDHTDADFFAGVAAENCIDWVIDETIYVRVWTQGFFWFNHASAAVTDLGAEFEPAEDVGPQTVDNYATTNAVCVGRAVGYATDRLLININGYALGSGLKDSD